jgi:hypothetical protein
VRWFRNKDIRWSRVRAASIWVIRDDLGGALTVMGLGVAVGAAFVAKGLVKIEDPTAYYGGIATMLVFLVGAVVVVVVAIVGRYTEITFRHRLETRASNGRVMLSSLIAAEGAVPAARANLDPWAADVRELLREMDETGLLVQRFDITAGLSIDDPRLRRDSGGLGPTTEAGIAARELHLRLARLGEFMQESPR